MTDFGLLRIDVARARSDNSPGSFDAIDARLAGDGAAHLGSLGIAAHLPNRVQAKCSAERWLADNSAHHDAGLPDKHEMLNGRCLVALVRLATDRVKVKSKS
jgi:hypothetical protein